MAKSGINRTVSIPQPSIFGRIGTGFGQGLAEQLPKEIERNRLTSRLNELGQQKDLSPFQQFTGLVGAAHEYPQVIQSGADYLRQQSILNSIKENQKVSQPSTSTPQSIPKPNQENNPASVTTTQGTFSKINPYVPPGGQDIETAARQKMANEPLIYPTLDAARAAVNNEIAGNINRSNAAIAAETSREGVQTKAENELSKSIDTRGVNVPGPILSDIQQKAIKDVRDGKLTPEAAGVKYGEETQDISNHFSALSSLGDYTLITKSPEGVNSAIKNIRKDLKKVPRGLHLGALTLIKDSALSPELSFSLMKPNSDIKPLDKFINTLPEIKHPQIKKGAGAPGLAGLGTIGTSNQKSINETLKIIPELVKLMGTEGSPLAIAKALDEKGFNGNTWKNNLIDNKENYNLTSDQNNELSQSPRSFFGLLNDLWFNITSGRE